MIHSRSMAVTRVRSPDIGLSGGTRWGPDIVPHDIGLSGTDASAEFVDLVIGAPVGTRPVDIGSGRRPSAMTTHDYTVISSSAATTSRDVVSVLSKEFANKPIAIAAEAIGQARDPYFTPHVFEIREAWSLQSEMQAARNQNLNLTGLVQWVTIDQVSPSLRLTAAMFDDLPDDLGAGAALIRAASESAIGGFETIIREIAAIPGCGLPVSNRLRELRLQQGDDPESAEMSVESMASFVAFLHSVRGIRLPSLSLTPDGNIYASWRRRDRVFSAEFRSDGLARYVLFRPAPGDLGSILRSAGSAPANRLLSIPETSPAVWAFS